MTKPLALALALLALPPLAHAQDNSTSFSIERLNPAPGGRGIVSLEDSRVEGQFASYFHILVSTAREPLVLRLDEGSAQPTVRTPVRHLTSFHVSMALELHRKARFSLVLPFMMLTGDRLHGLGDDREFPPLSSGDMSVGFTFNVWTGQVIPLSVATNMQVFLPSGDDSNFAGAGQPGLVLRALVGAHPFEWLLLLGHFGGHFHDKRAFYGSVWGTRLPWGVGFELGLPWIPVVGKHLGIFSELDGEVCLDCVTEDPLEIRGGISGRLGKWEARVSGGAGLSDAASVPSWRVTCGVGFKIGE